MLLRDIMQGLDLRVSSNALDIRSQVYHISHYRSIFFLPSWLGLGLLRITSSTIDRRWTTIEPLPDSIHRSPSPSSVALPPSKVQPRKKDKRRNVKRLSK